MLRPYPSWHSDRFCRYVGKKVCEPPATFAGLTCKPWDTVGWGEYFDPAEQSIGVRIIRVVVVYAVGIWAEGRPPSFEAVFERNMSEIPQVVGRTQSQRHNQIIVESLGLI